MDWQNSIRKLQIDITSYCNAKCPGCARNISGDQTVDFLKLSHFDVNIWNRLVKDDLKDTRVESLTLNGNWGDCGMHPKLPIMLKTFIEYHSRTAIFLATNGGMHDEQWWKELGNVLKDSASHVVAFALDGLEDTNHIYRRNVNYAKVINNIKAFISGKGRAQLIFTVFDHNKHQIGDIVNLGKDLGCAEVKIRKSFKESMHVKSNSQEYVVTSDYNKPDLLYIVNDVDEISKQSPYDYTETFGTSCPWYNLGEVQIDPWHNVWPCCHISNNQFYNNEEISIVKTLGLDNFNLRNNSLKEILSSTYYNKTLSNAVKCGTWEVCRQSCDIQIDK